MPHALRLLIPNLAIIAISQTEFPDEVIRYAGTTYLDPWYGGEAGQIMLINLHKKEIFCHSSPGYRRSGAITPEPCRRNHKNGLQAILLKQGLSPPLDSRVIIL